VWVRTRRHDHARDRGAADEDFQGGGCVLHSARNHSSGIQQERRSGEDLSDLHRGKGEAFGHRGEINDFPSQYIFTIAACLPAKRRRASATISKGVTDSSRAILSS